MPLPEGQQYDQVVSLLGSMLIKLHDQKQHGKKGFAWVILLGSGQSPREVRVETQAGQEPGGRSSCRGHGGCCLLA